MREILFKGERVDHSDWVVGMPCATEKSGIYAIQTLQGGIFDIIPETLGQYTGLTDKNGAKIFEGDILSVTVNEMGKPTDDLIALGLCDEKTKMPTGNKIKTVWTVEHKDQFCFGIGFYLYGKDRRFNIKLSKKALLNANAEVIGNIHADPECTKKGV